MKSGYDKFFKQARGQKSEPARNSKAQEPKPPTSTAEQVALLRNRMSARKRRLLQKRMKLPVFPIVAASMALGVWVASGMNLDRAEELLAKIEVGVFGEAAAESGSKPAENTGKKDSEKSTAAAANAEAKGGSDSESVASNRSWSEEELALFKKLDERKKALDQREKELGRMEEELQRQRSELEDKLKKLDELREKIGKQLENKIQADGGRVDKLVAFYTNMRPQNAAKIFQDMNEDLAVEILEKMKQKSAAEIMNLLPPDKAQRLTEKFAGYKRR